MSDSMHQINFPGEGDEYRSARNELLRAELDLRQRLEEIAALRRKLPLGGKVEEDYIFDERSEDGGTTSQVRHSELFEPGKDSLLIYSYMFGPDDELPCPMCTSFLDGLDASAPHVTQRISLAVVAKSPIRRIRDWADTRGWTHLRLLSSENNSYNGDYFAETPEGQQLPACNVFTKTSDGIYHTYATEMLYAPVKGHPRHMDLLWPIWNLFDLTPEGRGEWMPQLSY